MGIGRSPRFLVQSMPAVSFPATRIAFLTHEHENFAQTLCCEIAEAFALLKNEGLPAVGVTIASGNIGTGRRRFEIKLQLGPDV